MSSMTEEEWREEFQSVLDSVGSSGSFCIGRELNPPLLHPKIRIDGLGDERLAFPLHNSQAKTIKGVAETAPFGKGMETVVDEAVRKAWQIDSSKVLFDDEPAWNSFLKTVVQDCADGLGLKPKAKASVKANLYNMLLYESGGHFNKHRDTEKEPGMFGTLVIQLPAKFTGGALVIEHRGEQKKLDFSAKSQDGFYATAFFADCEHELQEVKSGWRLCLVYNLVLQQSTQDGPNSCLPCADDLTAQTKQLRNLASMWTNPDFKMLNPVQGYLLEHDYTETNLSFKQLKGRDQSVVDALRNVKDKDGRPLFMVCLVLLEKYESGSSEGGYDGMEEVYESYTSTNHWVGPDDKAINKFRLSFDLEDCLLTEEAVEDLFAEYPDKEEYAGPTIEYWYYRGAVAFWPREKNLEIAQMAGLSSLVSCLNSADVLDVPSYARSVVAMLEGNKDEVDTQVLRALLRANDVSLIARAFKTISKIGNKELAKGMIEVMKHLNDDDLNKAALDVLHRTSAIYSSHSNHSGVQHAAVFLNLLAPSGLEDLIPLARECVVRGALIHPESLTQSQAIAIPTIAKIAFMSPLFSKYIDVVISTGSKTSLRLILEALLHFEGVENNPDALRLARHRSSQLSTDTEQGAPNFSLSQPKAKFPGSQSDAVNRFLHSQESTKTFHGFNGIDHARNWKKQLLRLLF